MKTKMKVKRVAPLQDRVVVERQEQEAFSMIETPDSAKEKPVQGIVVAIGPGKRLQDGSIVPVAVAKGDIVLFAKYGGVDIELGPGQEYLILREDEIMGRVEEVEEEESEEEGTVAEGEGTL